MEDKSPEWGRKPLITDNIHTPFNEWKISPLNGDGNSNLIFIKNFYHHEWKISPLNGDGNFTYNVPSLIHDGMEDKSPEWGRKLLSLVSVLVVVLVRMEDKSPEWGRKL